MNLLLGLALLILSPSEPARRLPPIDECASDLAFAAFRSGLIEAVEQRDAVRLLAAVGENIEFDFDDGSGRDRFATNWHLDRPQDSPLWDELGTVLSLGCARSGDGAYWSPSLAASNEIDDPFATFLVIRPGATMHASADAGSAVLANLDWDLVERVEWAGENPWWKVRLADGREGYVRGVDLRSPVDYRAGFERIDGRWQMTVFITGD
ncbi:MAG: SH3 domain-containing protein [Allosphingosinicella sp.]